MIALDCGHNSTPSNISAGYGRDDNGKTYCFDCAALRDKEHMQKRKDPMSTPTRITVTVGLGAARKTAELLAMFFDACEPDTIAEMHEHGIFQSDLELVASFARDIAGPVYGNPLGDALKRLQKGPHA